jgi:hypothetical protein
MEKINEFRADRFASLTLWFHFCKTYQLDLCPRCERGARQPLSSPVPAWRWICTSCASESAHQQPPQTCCSAEKADDVAVPAWPHHRVGSGSRDLIQAKLAFPKIEIRVA